MNCIGSRKNVETSMNGGLCGVAYSEASKSQLKGYVWMIRNISYDFHSLK